MPTPLSPLPGDLGVHFSISSAAALGVGRSRLAHASLHRPARGVRSRDAVTTVVEAAAGLATAMPGRFAFSHDTAALIMGLPTPRPWAPGARLDIMQESPLRSRRPEVIGHRGLERRRVILAHDLPVIHPAQVFLDVAVARADRRWPVPDLVALGDAISRWGPAWRQSLVAATSGYAGRPGAAYLSSALALVRVGAESPMESRTRVVFVTGGLPEPELNQDIFSPTGAWLGRVDMLWRRARVVGEYEGDGHRSERKRWRADIDRVRRMEGAGYRVIRITSDDLASERSRQSLVDLVRQVLSERAGASPSEA